ncbi:MAG: heavy metal translocating P-type ATPase metal-binding domain-containing protein [Flavobacteriales bacterium]|nr:heavy metal translocating P-type ATPase metal-binding domain-containing protein [Flavobacteriales bacterium]MCB9447291.1 heavy metal translocating P-type ATPase metal-binding domain-containing protein [Flavobacteriales bacterium]
MKSLQKKTASDTLMCTHCGDPCNTSPIVDAEEHPFCCEGCKTVYEILHASGLDDYYVLEKNPGRKQSQQEHRYAYLDNREIVEKLLHFHDGHMANITLFLPQIHCSSCIWLLENLHRLNPAIYRCEVDFVKKEAFITFDESALPLRQLADLLATIGYPPRITLDQEKPEKPKQDRGLLYRIGVAAFAFGNIMLLSFPEYLHNPVEIDGHFRSAFGLISLALSLPVAFYAASGYFASALTALRSKTINIDIPIALGIAALFMRSTYEILAGTGPGYMDSLTGLVFFLLIGKWYQSYTYRALAFDRDYTSYFPIGVTLLNGSAETQVPIHQLKAGQRVRIRHQELIPADGTLVEGDGQIDYSFVTGESDPTPKHTGDPVYAGGKQTGEAITVELTKAVSQSYLTRLWNQEVFRKNKDQELSQTVQKVSYYFTIGILSIALITGITWWLLDPSKAWHAITAVLIIACPCALALTLPFTFGNALRVLGRKGLYLKNAQTIEKMAHLDAVVFDKTGTLTMGGNATLTFESDTPLDTEETSLIRSLTHHSGHPHSRIIYQSLKGNIQPVEEYTELPFKGISGAVNGMRVRLGSDVFVTHQTIPGHDQAARVYISINGNVRGYFRIARRYRDQMNETLNILSSQYDLSLLSGDDDADRQQLSACFPNKNQLLFRQSPMDKLQYVQKKQEAGHHVLMVGDGLNDAGALKQADVGLAISEDVYSFSPSCDAILEGRQLHQLPRMLQYARRCMRITYASFGLSFTYNIIGISYAATGHLTPLIAAILMPLSSVTIVAFTTAATFLLGRRIR